MSAFCCVPGHTLDAQVTKAGMVSKDSTCHSQTEEALRQDSSSIWRSKSHDLFILKIHLVTTKLLFPMSVSRLKAVVQGILCSILCFRDVLFNSSPFDLHRDDDTVQHQCQIGICQTILKLIWHRHVGQGHWLDPCEPRGRSWSFPNQIHQPLWQLGPDQHQDASVKNFQIINQHFKVGIQCQVWLRFKITNHNFQTHRRSHHEVYV